MIIYKKEKRNGLQGNSLNIQTQVIHKSFGLHCTVREEKKRSAHTGRAKHSHFLSSPQFNKRVIFPSHPVGKELE